MKSEQDSKVRDLVREHYARIATPEAGASCAPGCCGANPDASRKLGYTADELASLPEGANLGLGCGNPQAIAELRPGDRVLDLGSGGGIDSFLAARRVGPTGRVIGVDMTPEMLQRARDAAARMGLDNVEFRLGEIEHLPVAENEIDVILSNCVINLSPDKARVFREAYRVLKPGGRLAVSDIVATAPIPAALRSEVEALSGCVSGAAPVDTLQTMLEEAGFTDVQVSVRPESREFIKDWLPGKGAEHCVASAVITATKPAAPCCQPGCCNG
jgi:SAM-dependent methyltransferase